MIKDLKGEADDLRLSRWASVSPGSKYRGGRQEGRGLRRHDNGPEAQVAFGSWKGQRTGPPRPRDPRKSQLCWSLDSHCARTAGLADHKRTNQCCFKMQFAVICHGSHTAFTVVQSLSCVRLFVTPWTTALSPQACSNPLSDAIQASHPLSSPSPAFNLSQHQDLFQ